jgi:hypothetical protein
MKWKRLVLCMFAHLEYITAIWYILWPFGYLVTIRYILHRFGILCREKIWQPCIWAETQSRASFDISKWIAILWIHSSPGWPDSVNFRLHICRLFILGCFLKMTKAAPIMGTCLPRYKLWINVAKKGWATNLGRFLDKLIWSPCSRHQLLLCLSVTHFQSALQDFLFIL